MLETRVTVIEIAGSQTFVRSQVGGCDQCQGKGCAASKLSQLFCNKPRQFLVDNQIDARVGDQVVVVVKNGAVLRGIGLVYLLPLLCLFAGAAFASVFANQPETVDYYTALGAAAGLVIGFGVSKKIVSGRSQQLPYIARNS